MCFVQNRSKLPHGCDAGVEHLWVLVGRPYNQLRRMNRAKCGDNFAHVIPSLSPETECTPSRICRFSAGCLIPQTSHLRFWNLRSPMEIADSKISNVRFVGSSTPRRTDISEMVYTRFLGSGRE